MSQYFKRWRSSALTVLGVVALVAPALNSFAQQPGEWSSYGNEKVKSAGFVQMHGTLAEAKNGGNLLDVWVGNSNSDAPNPLFFSINNGKPFQVGNTATFASPAVAPFGTGSFFVVQTGTDGRIYWTVVSGNGANTGQWFPIPGQTTPNTMSVSVAPIGQGSLDEFVVFRGAGSDTRIFGIWVNDAGVWSTPVNFSGGLGVAPPAVCLNNAGQTLWAVAIGLDNQVWTTRQPLGASSWFGWSPQGRFTGQFNNNSIQGPRCAATANGNVLVDYVDSNGQPNYAVFNNVGQLVTGWTQDTSGFQTNNSVGLRGDGETVFSLITGLQSQIDFDGGAATDSLNQNDESSGFGWWKQLYVAQ